MKLLSGTVMNNLVSTLKTEGQRAWYGVARDMVLDGDEMRVENPEDERKGYKYDEVADIRSLLDQFMTTTAADKALTCLRPKLDEPFLPDLPENADVLMFFRQRLAPPPQQETALVPIDAVHDLQTCDQNVHLHTMPQTHLPAITHSHLDRYASKPGYTDRGVGARAMERRSHAKRIANASEQQTPQQQEEYRAKITGKVTSGRTLLQELGAKLKEKEARTARSQNRNLRGRKWHDSADYP